MNDDIKEILDNPKILMLSYGNYISLDDYFKLKDYITNLQEKYERLRTELNAKNNIINELEKYIKDNSIFYNTSDGCQWIDQFKVLDKLEELKENNNG